MPRKRSPARDKAYKLWIESNKKKLLKEIAIELGVLETQVRKWKSQDKWEHKGKGTLPNVKGNVTKQKESPKTSEIKPRYPNGHPGNKNPVKKFAERNQAARKHGLFSRYMPKETLEIMEQMDGATEVDLLWTQIQIQFANLIRSQEIMFVQSRDEMIKEVKKEKLFSNDSGSSEEIEYDFQFAWDRQATALNSQARAMSELRASIKQFMNLTHDDDERRLKLEGMQLKVEKTKAEIETLKGPKEGQGIKDWKQAVIDAANKRKEKEHE